MCHPAMRHPKSLSSPVYDFAQATASVTHYLSVCGVARNLEGLFVVILHVLEAFFQLTG